MNNFKELLDKTQTKQEHKALESIIKMALSLKQQKAIRDIEGEEIKCFLNVN